MRKRIRNWYDSDVFPITLCGLGIVGCLTVLFW